MKKWATKTVNYNLLKLGNQKTQIKSTYISSLFIVPSDLTALCSQALLPTRTKETNPYPSQRSRHPNPNPATEGYFVASAEAR
jgi:hypothetical protein